MKIILGSMLMLGLLTGSMSFAGGTHKHKKDEKHHAASDKTCEKCKKSEKECKCDEKEHAGDHEGHSEEEKKTK